MICAHDVAIRNHIPADWMVMHGNTTLSISGHIFCSHVFRHWSVGGFGGNFPTATEAYYSNTFWFNWVHREIAIDDSTMAALNLLNEQSQSRWFCRWALPSYQCLLSCEPQRDLIWQAKGEGMEMEMACVCVCVFFNGHTVIPFKVKLDKTSNSNETTRER